MEIIDQIVAEILHKALAIDPNVKTITPETPLVELDINSLNFVQLVVQLEKVFGDVFDDEQMDYVMFNTVGELIAHIKLGLPQDWQPAADLREKSGAAGGLPQNEKAD